MNIRFQKFGFTAIEMAVVMAIVSFMMIIITSGKGIIHDAKIMRDFQTMLTLKEACEKSINSLYVYGALGCTMNQLVIQKLISPVVNNEGAPDQIPSKICEHCVIYTAVDGITYKKFSVVLYSRSRNMYPPYETWPLYSLQKDCQKLGNLFKNLAIDTKLYIYGPPYTPSEFCYVNF